MSPTTLDYAQRAEFDTGRFVARYFQVLAWVSIASMIAGPILFDRLYIDLTPVLLFWAASKLKQRSQIARKWTLAVTGLTLGLMIWMLIWAMAIGTKGMSVSVGFRRVKDPALWQVAAAVVPLFAIIGVPFAVLMSKRAKRQFGGGSIAA